MDWLPPYTEQWATAYLQILFQGFLFALGVPTAIYSLIVDNDIKRVAQTRVKARNYFLATSLLYAALFVIVWFLHPEKSQTSPATGSQTSTQQQSVTPTPPASTQPQTSPAPQAAAQSQASPKQAQPSPNAQATGSRKLLMFSSIFAAATVTFLPVGVLASGLLLINEFKREKVVKRLADELLKTLDAKRSIDTVALADLSYLGEHGRAGAEKEMVLNVIDGLVKTVQKEVRDHELIYNGYELESLIRHIPLMLDNRAQPGDDENYRRAGELLTDIWRWVSVPKVTDDALSTREALRRLALQSVRLTTEDTVLGYLEIAADCDSQMVFDIGVASLEEKKYTLAVAALTKLEAMAETSMRNQSPEAGHAMANAVGMAAHLAASAQSGAIRARMTLQDLDVNSRNQALNDAFNYHYGANRFDIADEISSFQI